MDTDRLLKLLLFMFITSLAATIFLAYALFVALPRQRVIAQTGGCGVIYTVQSGDSLAGIAARCGVSLAELQALNPSITDQNLAAGQVLTIPQTVVLQTQLAPIGATPPTSEPTIELTPEPTLTAPTTAPQPTSGQVGGGIPGQDDQAGGGAPGAPTQPPAAGTPVPSTTQQDQAGGGAPTAAGASAQGFTYTVQPGDTLSGIAARFGVSLQAVINANPQITNPNLIFPGQVVNIPGTVPPTGGEDYIVQPGDTLSAIAARFGLTLSQLLAANPQITNPNLIFPGQAITIPDGNIPPTGGDVYTVQPGDTLSSIARRFGVTLGALLAANPQITDPNRISPGQQINIPTGDGNIPPTGGNTHVVQPGDTLSQIAALYGTTVAQLLALNPDITDPDLIFPGQVIQLP